MRFAVEIILKDKPPYKLPTNYRKNIISIIKEAVKSNDDGVDFLNEYWGEFGENKAKPFTFSLYIPNPRVIKIDENKFLEFDNPIIRLFISSSDSVFLSYLYDGFLKIDKEFTSFDYPIEIENIYFQKEKPIKSNPAKFKILSPIVVRDISIDGRSKRNKGYLTCEDSEFKNSLAYSIKDLCKRFLVDGNAINKDSIEINPSDCSMVRIYHYREVIPATKGIIEIKASEEVLGLIYMAGLGARRSQGFGMVEIKR